MSSSHESGVRVCPDPVFVIGAGRSGTTGLARALARHPDLWTSAETLFMPSLFGNRYLERDFDRWIKRPHASWLGAEDVSRDEFLSHIGLGINALMTNRSEGRRWIDHTPHHALMVDTLAAMFPGARFVHILRDGRSVVHSMVNVAKDLDPDLEARMKSGKFLPPWTQDFGAACKTWRDSVTAAMEAGERYPDRCLTVRHEALGAKPEEQFARMFDFIGVTPEEKCAKFWRSSRVNSSFGAGPRATPIETFRAWSPEQREIFRTEAAPTLVEYGLADAGEFEDSEAVDATAIGSE